MLTEHAIGIAGAAFFVVCGLGLIGSVRRGRELCRLFAQRLPDTYAQVGSPRPGYFDSPRRSAYLRFLLQRGFEELADPLLIEEFSRLRRSELRKLVFLLAGFAGFGLALLLLHFAPAG